MLGVLTAKNHTIMEESADEHDREGGAPPNDSIMMHGHEESMLLEHHAS